MRRGLTLALGTDSRASNPDLDLRREIAFAAAAFPHVPPSFWLAASTIQAAMALGIDGELGSIAPGKRAALAAIRLDSGIISDPLELWQEHIDRLEPLEVAPRGDSIPAGRDCNSE
jgi:imidazolonepropionase-like amidohydrolase